MSNTLYYHRTDGGAEYLCTSPVDGTNEGDLYTTIIRLDGEPELLNPVYATAPELLEALKAVSASLHEAIAITDGTKNYNQRWQREFRQAFAVIQKAGG